MVKITCFIITLRLISFLQSILMFQTDLVIEINICLLTRPPFSVIKKYMGSVKTTVHNNMPLYNQAV